MSIFSAIVEAQDRQTAAIKEQTAELVNCRKAITLGFARVVLELSNITKLLSRPAKPGAVSLIVVSQGDNMALQYKLVLPPPGASDVMTRTITVNGVPQDLAADAIEVDGLEGDAGDPVTGTLVDVDASGNASEPRPFDFVLTDTIAPPEPGEIGLVVTGQD